MKLVLVLSPASVQGLLTTVVLSAKWRLLDLSSCLAGSAQVRRTLLRPPGDRNASRHCGLLPRGPRGQRITLGAAFLERRSCYWAAHRPWGLRCPLDGAERRGPGSAAVAGARGAPCRSRPAPLLSGGHAPRPGPPAAASAVLQKRSS